MQVANRVHAPTVVSFEADDRSYLSMPSKQGTPHVRRLVIHVDLSVPSMFLLLAASGHWSNLTDITVIFSRRPEPPSTQSMRQLDMDLTYVFLVGLARLGKKLNYTFVDGHLTDDNPFDHVRHVAFCWSLPSLGGGATLQDITARLLSVEVNLGGLGLASSPGLSMQPRSVPSCTRSTPTEISGWVSQACKGVVVRKNEELLN